MKCPFVIKICSKCGELLVANEMNFVKKKGGKWGLRADCKKCQKQYYKEYYEDNKEQIAEKNKEYYEDNKGQIAEVRKQYYEDNKEYISEYHKQYYEDNKEHYKQYYEDNKEQVAEYYKQYYRDNKEQIAEKKKRYYEDNKEYYKQYYEDNKEQIVEKKKRYYEDNKEQIAEKKKRYYEDNPEKLFNKNNKRRQLEENQGNGITKEQWLEMMKFFDFKCAYSGITLSKETRTIDHIIALNKGGLNEVWNCVPMLKKLNSQKQTKNMLKWYKQQEFYSEEKLNKIYEWIEYAKNKWNK